MKEQLYRRVVRTDGHEGHWFDYEPVEMSCKGCKHENGSVYSMYCNNCTHVNYNDCYEEV